MKKVKKIIIVVEFEDGSFGEVLAPYNEKKMALSFLSNDEKQLRVSKEILPISINYKNNLESY